MLSFWGKKVSEARIVWLLLHDSIKLQRAKLQVLSVPANRNSNFECAINFIVQLPGEKLKCSTPHFKRCIQQAYPVWSQRIIVMLEDFFKAEDMLEDIKVKIIKDCKWWSHLNQVNATDMYCNPREHANYQPRIKREESCELIMSRKNCPIHISDFLLMDDRPQYHQWLQTITMLKIIKFPALTW